jgi:hypothetical protein
MPLTCGPACLVLGLRAWVVYTFVSPSFVRVHCRELQTPDSTCVYGPVPAGGEKLARPSHVVGTAQAHLPAWDRTEYLHSAEITGLLPNTEYSYQCGSVSAGVLSPPVAFHTDTPFPTIAWLGDTGNHPLWTSRTVPTLSI